MAVKANNYEGIAGIYGFLKNLILGKNPVLNEVHHLRSFDQIDNLLVIGCGSSEFLEHINTKRFQRITCLDFGRKMCDLSKKRANSIGIGDKIEIVQSDFIKWQNNSKYDLISLPYILDCQKDEDIHQILDKCYHLASENSNLIISDFSKAKNIRQKWLLKAMYVFFKLSTQIPRMSVPDYESFIDLNKWELQNRYEHPKFGLFSLKIGKKPA